MPSVVAARPTKTRVSTVSTPITVAAYQTGISRVGPLTRGHRVPGVAHASVASSQVSEAKSVTSSTRSPVQSVMSSQLS